MEKKKISSGEKEQEKPRLGQEIFFLKLQRSVDAAESRARLHFRK